MTEQPHDFIDRSAVAPVDNVQPRTSEDESDAYEASTEGQARAADAEAADG